MKRATFFILSAIFIIAIILLLLWDGTNWLQGVYIWIAELENSFRGIDGISQASRVKVMDDAVRHFPALKKACIAILAIALFILCFISKRKSDKNKH